MATAAEKSAEKSKADAEKIAQAEALAADAEIQADEEYKAQQIARDGQPEYIQTEGARTDPDHPKDETVGDMESSDTSQPTDTVGTEIVGEVLSEGVPNSLRHARVVTFKTQEK